MNAPTEESSAPTGILAGAAYGAMGFGALGLCAPIFSLGSRELTRLMTRLAPNPALARIDTLLWTGTYGTWTKASLALSFALSAVLVATGLGLRKKRRWAGQLGLLYCIFQALFVIVQTRYTFAVLMPALNGIRDELASDPVGRESISFALPGMVMGNVFGVAMVLGMSVLLRHRAVRTQLTR